MGHKGDHMRSHGKYHMTDKYLKRSKKRKKWGSFCNMRSPGRCSNRQASSTSGSPRNQVLPINQASSGEAVFPSIQNPVPVYPPREEYRVSSGEEIIYTPPPPQTIQAQEIYVFYPEQIYIVGVIPMRSPLELREFEHHCITWFTNQT